MKRTILTAACLAFVLGLGAAVTAPTAAFAAGEKKMESPCDKIKNEKKKAACEERLAKTKKK